MNWVADAQSTQAHQGAIFKGQTAWGKGGGDACNLPIWDIEILSQPLLATLTILPIFIS